MKTIILVMSILTSVTFSSLKAQDNDEVKNVPAKVKSEFAKLYPTVKDVKWSTEDSNYEGKFTYNMKEMSVQINNDGELVQKETYLKLSELPKPVQDYLSKNYAGVNFDEYSEVTDSKNVKHYQAESEDKILFFDSNGTFLKAEKNEE